MFNKLTSLTFILFIIVTMFCLPVKSEEVVFSQVEVTVNQQSYPLEYAFSFEQRAQGLMLRESMCETCGMLFNFQQARGVSMWMKNTLIPLDVAFIRADGFIVNIEAMKPHDLNTTSSLGKVLYAWEMNQGWFAQNGVSIGDTVVVKE